MPTIEHVQALGAEIERLRNVKRAEFPTVKALAKQARLSNNRLGEIIKGYKHPSRGFTIPSDDALERLAEALDAPVSRFHGLLGRFPDVPFPAFDHPDTLDVAETYDKLPDYGKKMLRDMLKIVVETVAAFEERSAK